MIVMAMTIDVIIVKLPDTYYSALHICTRVARQKIVPSNY